MRLTRRAFMEQAAAASAALLAAPGASPRAHAAQPGGPADISPWYRNVYQATTPDLAGYGGTDNMIYQLRDLKSRAATAENPDALPGKGGMTGQGLKGSPAIKDFKDGATERLLDVDGPGCVRHIWLTSHARKPSDYRNIILRMYWEGSEEPSVAAPLSDFFGVAHGVGIPMQSAYVSMQEGRGFNCYFPMPFARHARITVTNETGEPIDWFFYQVDFTLGDAVNDETGRFHAHFRRENPTTLGEDFTIVDTSGGRGIYMGCVLGIRPLSPGWWGEGEVKMYIDDDEKYPTICGTGTEDYIGSAWGLDRHCTPFQGAPLNHAGFASLYRFHGPDPVYYQERIHVTVQTMGGDMKPKLLERYGDDLYFQPKNHPRRHPDDGFYLRQDDWCATAYWYQYPLVRNLPPLPGKAARTADLFGSAREEKGTADL